MPLTFVGGGGNGGLICPLASEGNVLKPLTIPAGSPFIFRM